MEHSKGESSSESQRRGPIRPVRITPGKSEAIAVNEGCFVNLWNHLGGQVTLHETKKYYDIKACRYDEEMTEQNYRGPQIIVDKMKELGARKDFRVLDVGCGTGLLGEALKKAGFSQIYGIDMSAEMLRVNKKKQFYSKLQLMVVQPDTNLSSLESFDIIILLSTLQPGHVTPLSLQNIATILNAKGHLIWARSSEIPSRHFTDSFNETRWAQLKEALKEKGLKCIEEKSVIGFVKDKPGDLGVFLKN